MPFHFCTDELLAILAMIPFIGYFFGKLHAWWHKHFHLKCHEDGCKAEHVEHCKMPSHIPHGKAGEGQCDQHPYSPYGRHGIEPFTNEEAQFFTGTPAPLKVMIPVTIEEEENWDSISEEDVEERFGQEVLTSLMVELMVSPLDYPIEGEVHWFVNGNNTNITAHINERVFLCDVSLSKRWIELLQ